MRQRAGEHKEARAFEPNIPSFFVPGQEQRSSRRGMCCPGCGRSREACPLLTREPAAGVLLLDLKMKELMFGDYGIELLVPKYVYSGLSDTKPTFADMEYGDIRRYSHSAHRDEIRRGVADRPDDGNGYTNGHGRPGEMAQGSTSNRHASRQ